jgi:outer membrane receptor protein involved in Fe transport
LASAAGAEIGLRSVLIPRTQVTFALWTLGVASELVFVGDAGTTTAGRPSRRSGVELSAYTALVPHIHADVDLALSRARFTDEDASGHRIPGAAGLVASAGLSLESWRRLDAGLRWRYLGARPLVEDGSVRSAPTGLLNARLGYAVTRQLRLGVEGFNLLSAGVSDVDYFYVSRLPGEPLEGVADRHTHPMPRRSFRAALTVHW